MYGHSTKIGSRIGQNAGKTGWRKTNMEAQRHAYLRQVCDMRRTGQYLAALGKFRAWKRLAAKYVK